jgi:hypothetical protein
MDRKETRDLKETYGIPPQTIAVVAAVASPSVSLYMSDGVVSGPTQSKIERAVRLISELCLKYGTTPLDLHDALRIKQLTLEMQNPAYSIALAGTPVRFFVRNSDSGVLTTLGFLQAARLDRITAEAICGDLRDSGYEPAICENDYAGTILTYAQAMNISAVAAK